MWTLAGRAIRSGKFKIEGGYGDTPPLCDGKRVHSIDSKEVAAARACRVVTGVSRRERERRGRVS